MAHLAGLDGPELRATFNAGIGMALVVEPAAVTRRHRPAGRPRPGGLGHRVGRAGLGRGTDALCRGGRMSDGVRIAVGVSGQGSNLRALHAAQRRGVLGGTITTVFADRVCPGVDWAIEQGIPVLLVPPSGHPDRASWDMGLAAGLQHAEADVVVLAGFLRILGPSTAGGVPGSHRQCPSIAAARVPRSARHRGRARGACRGHRRDRASRGRDARRRAHRGPGGRPGPAIG